MAERTERAFISTTGDFANGLVQRDNARSAWETELRNIEEQIARSRRELKSDLVGDIPILTSLLQASIIEDNKPVQDFASELMTHLMGGGSAEVFIEDNPHYRNLDISNLVVEDLGEQLLSPPIGGIRLIGEGERVERGEIFDSGTAQAKLTGPISTETDFNEDKKERALMERYPAVRSLFETDNLWVEDPDSNFGQRFTARDNIAALLVKGEINDSKLPKASAVIAQTLNKRWKTAYKEDFGEVVIGRRIPGYGKNLLYSEQETRHLISFMDKNMGTTIRTPNRIRDDDITNWPFEKKSPVKKNY